MSTMQESDACAVLKARFEEAGFNIVEHRMFDEDGIRFEMDGFDAERRVGYEYVTAEAGDGWDVDAGVIAALAERKQRGELFVLVVDEADAPDEATLRAKADAFLNDLPKKETKQKAPAKKPAAQKKPAAAKKSAAAKKKPKKR
jgi:hypothetical protein